MGVYLGNEGFVEIRRDSLNDPITGTLEVDDVTASKNRFSFDVDLNALITGDQIEIARRDKDANGDYKNLELVSGHVGDDYLGFVHVDDVGGMRLYTAFDDAICGDPNKAVTLITPSENQTISVTTKNTSQRCVAQITRYDITTTRETIDLTSLGDEFRRNYANGLISGQGTMECLWDYRCGLCNGVPDDSEFPHYLAQLAIRTEQGGDFEGFFYLDHSVENRYVWYEAKCIVTNIAMNVEPTQLIRTRVQFVMTGDIRLKIGTPPAFVEQEDGSLILIETADKITGGLLLEDD